MYSLYGKHIIILPNGGIGDSLQLSSLCELIKNQCSECTITFAGYSAYQNKILEDNPWIDNFIVMEKDDPKSRSDLKFAGKLIKSLYHALRVDIVIMAIDIRILSGLFQRAVDFFWRLLRKQIFILHSRGIETWEEYKDIPSASCLSYQAEFCKIMNYSIDSFCMPKIFLRKENYAVADAFIKEHRISRLAVINQESAQTYKILPDRIACLYYDYLTSIGFNVVFMKGVFFDNQLEFKKYHLQFDDHNIKNSAAFLSRTSLYIGPDSGLSHIAAALGISTVVIFGPTNMAFFPPGDNVYIIEKSLKCRFRTESYCYQCNHKDYNNFEAVCMNWPDRDDLKSAIGYFKIH